MKRRNFILSTGAIAAGFLNSNILFGNNLSGVLARNLEVPGDDTSVYHKDKLTHIGELTLEELKETYEQELFDVIIPMWYKKGIDNKYGGFLCEINYEDETFAVQYGCKDEIVLTDIYGYDDNEDFNSIKQ